MIREALVPLGFSLLVPRGIKNAGKRLTSRHGLQTGSRRPQRDQFIITPIEVQAMLEDDSPQDQRVGRVYGIHRELLAAKIVPAFDFRPDVNR